MYTNLTDETTQIKVQANLTLIVRLKKVQKLGAQSHLMMPVALVSTATAYSHKRKLEHMISFRRVGQIEL